MTKAKYLEIRVGEKHPTVLMTEWLSNNSEMTDDDFKDSIRGVVEFLKENTQVKAICSDSKQKQFTMSITIQEWHDREIIPEFAALGIKKTAFLMSEYAIAQMAIEQTFDEEAAEKAMDMKFFADKEEALEWLEKE